MGEVRAEPRVAPVIQFYAIIGPQQYTHSREEECTVTGNYLSLSSSLIAALSSLQPEMVP